MDLNYDEDLSENPLFKELKNEHPDLLNRAIQEGWIICVPRCGTFHRNSITTEDILSHVLIPNDELPETHFRSLNNRSVRMSNRVLTIDKEDTESTFSTHIIFEETFYTEDFLKYKVWCLEFPLETSDNVNETNIYNVNTLRDCIDLLWTENLGKEILENLDSTIQIFLNDINNNLEFASLQTQIDLVNILYKDCLQITFREKRLRDKTSRNKLLLDNVKLAVETYMQHGIYKRLFEAICARTASEDSKFNKLVRNLSDIQLKDLDVRPDLNETIPCAKQELAKMPGYSTTLGKVGCLKKTIVTITKTNLPTNQFKTLLSADELIPIIVFLIIKTGLPNWFAQLTFLSQFRYSSNDTDEASFLITTLEAAIEHIRSGLLFGPYSPESQLDDDVDGQSFEMIHETPISNDTKTNDNEYSISYFFEQIRIANYDEVKSILDRDNKTNRCNNVLLEAQTSKLCHPLCSCDKCEKVLTENLSDSMPTIHSYDDRGLTALHVACFHGRPKIVDLLLLSGANVRATDYSGATPLHYAALRGHQNALLLLLHARADINSRDNDKNTPLHFASNNGHEGCVKAMLYFSEHCPTNFNINCVNSFGDTPLHHASRWGYVGIVEILLEYGARANIENKRKLTPLDCAHSIHVTKLIYERKAKQNTVIIPLIPENKKSNINPQLDFADDATNLTISNSNIGIRPQSTQQIKKVDSLLRAVAFGDINLICYYLNISLNKTDKKSKSSKCHPLCVCDKCSTPSTSNDPTLSRTDILCINVCNSDGVTPLHIAAMHGWLEITKLLLEHGARPNLVTKSKGFTPLHLCCQHRRPLIAEVLVNSELCSINQQDNRGNTALHYVCHIGDLRLAEILITAGANPFFKNIDGITPIDEAEERIYISLVNYLKNSVKKV
ncbi:ankyrin repeat domain-containing protein 27-like [Chrysoperla carnea]|uniref:ankyrin repeat domain-containing protein 27-like n=1 Tax=Chrysoperla carnea TaxID=189513 RepID=UPI001D093B74|nr:ankyrin repeat domain-containing protein 27-like [Chrysoperla carnea]